MTTDMPKKSWITHLPGVWVPYAQLMRLDRPAGMWLLFAPCVWSVSLADCEFHGGKILLFLLGTILMRGVGCIWNDFLDRDLDRRVVRTCGRPLANGAVSSQQAFVFAVVLALGGAGILFQFNPFTIWLGLFSLILVGVYPLMKYVTFWPQAVLGLTFTWGALMGWASIRGALGLVPLVLYGSCFFWTLAYDTIYAYQDIEDDQKVGVGSTALYFGGRGKGAIAGFYSVFFGGLYTIQYLQGFSWIYGMGISAALILSLILVVRLNLKAPKQCLRAFQQNKWIALIIWASVLLENLLR
ncbi:MAG: 4-hydroxybenzoate octaprenyltransferase [Alphaproteobacteria bacterium]